MSTTGIPRHLTTARVRAAKLEALGAAAVAWNNASDSDRGGYFSDLIAAAIAYAQAQPPSDGEPSS